MNKRERFLRACRAEEVDKTPIWLMRQAGRYLPEYRELRKEHEFLEICEDPKLSSQVTLMPLKRFDLDAAIMFADIMLPMEGMDVSYSIQSGVGPVVSEPVRDRQDVEELARFDAQRDVPYLLEAIRRVREEVDGEVAVIGFSGAPFTLASYLVEGKPSRSYSEVKRLVYRRPEIWRSLMDSLADTVTRYLEAQIDAGVDAVQLFDSWVGAMGPEQYSKHVRRHSKRILDAVERRGVPSIHFGTCNSGLLADMAEAGGDVLGVDWRIPIDEAWRAVDHSIAVQGNLDPGALLGTKSVVESAAAEVLERVAGRPGHVFNLGHGVLPSTPPESVEALVDFVHKETS